jgi:hypothetical protein
LEIKNILIEYQYIEYEKLIIFQFTGQQWLLIINFHHLQLTIYHYTFPIYFLNYKTLSCSDSVKNKLFVIFNTIG